jgi:hypothetical protein
MLRKVKEEFLGGTCINENDCRDLQSLLKTEN